MENKEVKSLVDIVKSENNTNRHPGIKLVCQFKKALNLEGSSQKADRVSNIIPENKNKILNESELYKFYKDNLKIGNEVLNKSETAEYFKVSTSTIRRLNDKLKEKNLLYTEGKNLYLNVEEGINNG